MKRNGRDQIVLHVDLSARSLRQEVIPEAVTATLLGGRGIGDWLLWHNLKPGIDPLAEENVLIFSPGLLNGTSAPTAGRTTILCKSPLTGFYLKTGAGGRFGAALRFAGVDHIVVHGRSETPVLLWIDPAGAELRDASELWGLGVRETNRRILQSVDDAVEVAAIGQAGENLVKYANVMLSVYHSASRGGAGAVMGAKGLKAVVARPGDGAVAVEDPEQFAEACNSARRGLLEDPMADNLFRYGTAGDVTVFNDIHRLPSRNWQEAHVEASEADTLGGRSWESAGYLKGRRGCSACSIHCHRFTTVDSGPYAGTAAGGPQLASVTRGGPNCGVANVEAVFRYNQLCNDFGLDGISTGASIGWLMETYEKGILSDEDVGTPLPLWGSEEALLSLTDAIAHRRGIGDLLAEETKTASERVGRGSWKWAVQSKGMSPSGVAMQAAYGYALAFAVNPRGPDHLHSETMAEFGVTPQARAVVRKITGDEKYAASDMTEKRAEIVRWHEDIYAATDGLGLCAFSTTCAYGVDETLLADFFRSATGLSMSADQIMLAGRRMMTLERCINLREGLTRQDDVLPWRIMNEPNRDLVGVEEPVMRQEMLDQMLDEYYDLHEWSRGGEPQDDLLRALGLGFVVGDEAAVSKGGNQGQ